MTDANFKDFEVELMAEEEYQSPVPVREGLKLVSTL